MHMFIIHRFIVLGFVREMCWGQHRLWTVLLALLMCTTALIADTNPDPITTLRILLIAPFPDPVLQPGYDAGHAIIPSGLLAVEEINNDSSLLPGYRLEAVVGDGGCNADEKAVSHVLENVIHRRSSDRVIGIVGPVCSEATQTLSEIINRQRIQLPLVTIANSPVLTVPDRYPFTYGVVSTSQEYANLIVRLYQEMNGRWKSVSLFYDANRLYHMEIYRSILTELESEGVDLDQIYTSPISPTYMPLEDVIQGGTRVVFVFSSRVPACMLMCRAIHLNMGYPRYQFIFTDRTVRNFEQCANESDLVFTYDQRRYRCSSDQLRASLHNYVFIDFDVEALSLEPENVTAVSGNTYQEYRTKYEEMLKDYGNRTGVGELPANQYAAPFYDAVWALALATNRTLETLDFDSKLDIWDASTLTSTFNNLSFRGVSSVVDFDEETGYSNSTISISRLEYNETSGEFVPVLKGYYNSGVLFDANDSNSKEVVLSLYINSAFDTSTEVLPRTVAIPGYILTILVFVATVVYHILHYHYRFRPSVKAASQTLNHFIFIGCYIMLASIILATTDLTFSLHDDLLHLSFCYTVVWLQNIGIVLVFSTLFVKYYRLYLVFLRTYDHRQNLSNAKLSVIVLVLVGIDLLILTIWTIFLPLEIDISVEFDPKSTMPTNREKRICRETVPGQWFTFSLLLYLGLLILAVVTISFLNRRIKQRDFNTTATTNVLIFFYILLLTILLPSVYLESNYSNINLKYILINTVYLAFTILCLVFLFTPPLLQRNRTTSQSYTLTQQLQKISNVVALRRLDSIMLGRRPSGVS
jgi:ABC-type branched-subunit amino acid transport system substrate-binding protein